MKVKVRAIVPSGGGIVVANESRQGRPHCSIPGGRPLPGETLPAALVREVAEETGLEVEVGPLLYVAEVVSALTTQEVNLIFLARLVGGDVDPDAVLTAPGDGVDVLPPILDVVFEDLAAGWAATPRFLGNVYASRSA